jgi:non-ribosomal peptide synthetase component F
MPKSINSVLAIVATLKTRAAYVPTDYSSPAKRNAFIFDNCETRVVLTDEPRAASLAAEGFERATLVFPGEATDSIGAPWIGQERAKVEHPTADDLAYILYTSGSTGLPKGVMHTHASATSFVHWAAETVGPRAEDRFSSHAPFHFDLSILDLYVPMTVGAAIVLVDEEMGKEPQTLAAYIAERKISVWYSVPSILALLAQYGHLDQHDYSALHTVAEATLLEPVRTDGDQRLHVVRAARGRRAGPHDTLPYRDHLQQRGRPRPRRGPARRRRRGGRALHPRLRPRHEGLLGHGGEDPKRLSRRRRRAPVVLHRRRGQEGR